VIAVDSSVVVAAFASWHELHERARTALDRRPRLPAHAALETYSVLTRLPPPHRAPAELVLAFIADRFPETYIVLPAKRHGPLLEELGSLGIAGAATYDALIAVTAREAGATLLSCDVRAASTYARLHTDVEYLG
jgi:predicted nucleic acid-binding protein